MVKNFFLALIFFDFFTFTFSQCTNFGPDGNCYWKGLDQTWFAAHVNCITIASIHNAILNSFIREYAQQLAIDEPFWIGGAVNYKNEWAWADLTNFTYTNWAPGEPKHNEIGYCIAQDPSSGKWKSTNCSEWHPTICSQLKSVPTIPCPEFFDHYSTVLNKCYSWEGTNLPTYDEMQQDCLNMNSTLVTVHNDVENAIVQGLAVAYDAPALLGLHDSYNNGSYVWSDGSKLNFQNWHDPPGDGDCAFLRIESMKWYPMKCADFQGDMSSELCEIPSLI